MIIALDRQHVGKPGKRIADMGAWGDLDGDGEASVIESEAIWTGMYLWHAELALRELGHTVYPMSHGRYSERHKAANEVGADVYIAAHLNAITGGSRTRSGQGANYAAVFYDHRSSEHNGKRLAESIGLQLGKLPAIGSRVRIWPARGSDWTRRAFSTISGVGRPVAICYEPAFLDYKPHQSAFFESAESVAVLGRALADGIHTWGQSRENT